MTFKLGSELGINIKLLQGGNIGSKIANSSDGEKVDIMISTVNVITQLSEARVYELDRVQQIVLDEADTLLDDSFSPAVLYLLRKFPVSKVYTIFNLPNILIYLVKLPSNIY